MMKLSTKQLRGFIKEIIEGDVRPPAMSGAGHYYEKKRERAAHLAKAIKHAKAAGVDPRIIRELEKDLDRARYVGD